MRTRKSLASLIALTIAAHMIACGPDSAHPTAPSGGPALATDSPLGTLASDPSLPQGVVTVKSTAPTPLAPADGDMVGAGSIVLMVTDPAPVSNVQWTFDVRFEIYENANPGTAVHSAAVPQGGGTTSYSVPAGVLQPDTLSTCGAHARRARAKGDRGRRSLVSPSYRSASIPQFLCSRLAGL